LKGHNDVGEVGRFKTIGTGVGGESVFSTNSKIGLEPILKPNLCQKKMANGIVNGGNIFVIKVDSYYLIAQSL
jgi:hypothetical protein